jgi:hypothetical protein
VDEDDKDGIKHVHFSKSIHRERKKIIVDDVMVFSFSLYIYSFGKVSIKVSLL